jgi:hypothetical protein
MLDLIMQAAQNTARRTRMIILHKAFCNSNIRHQSLIVAFKEKTSLIAKYARLQDENIRQ